MFRTGPNGRIRVDNQEVGVFQCFAMNVNVITARNLHGFHSLQATGSVYIGFQAKPWAVYRSGKTPDALFYDIILEENVLGVPISSLPIILTAVGVLVVSMSLAAHFR